MKAKLTFDLPEEADDHEMALKGMAIRIIIHDLFEEIRSKLKHDSGYFSNILDEETGERIKACDITLHSVRKWLNESLISENIPELR